MNLYCLAFSFYKTLTQLDREEQRHVLAALDRYLEDPAGACLVCDADTNSRNRRWLLRVSARLDVVVLRDGNPETFLRVARKSSTHSRHQFTESQAGVNVRTDALTAPQLREVLQTATHDWGWLLFLSPQQRQVVARRFNGVARISGPAGTGKTVTMLHRVAELANRNPLLPANVPSILVTSLVSDVTEHLRAQYRLLPNAVSGRVGFIHVDVLVKRILEENIGKQADAIYDAEAEACLHRLRQRHTNIDMHRRLKNWTDSELVAEFERTIRGRLVNSCKMYLKLRCQGRGRQFDEDTGKGVWHLYETYRRELGQQKLVTFAHRVNMALESLETKFEPYYDSIMIDEVQDLTLAHLQFLRALVNGGTKMPDRPDGLLLVGDGAQRIYSSGFTLTEAGIDVRGNAVVFRRNYRNTDEIVQASRSLTGEFEIEDLDETYHRGEQPIWTTRRGMRPRLVEAYDLDDQAVFIARVLRDYAMLSATRGPDAGILAPERWQVDAISAALCRAGVRHHVLTRESGHIARGVRVTTIHRARNFESTLVFVVGLSADKWPTSTAVVVRGTEAATRRERNGLAAGLLHVATQRARDTLYLLFDGEPLPLSQVELDRFELVKTDRVIRRDAQLLQAPPAGAKRAAGEAEEPF